MRLWWDRFGRLPAVPMVAGSLTLQAAFMLTLPVLIAVVPALLVVLAFCAYCLARPTKGWDYFWIGTVPQYGSLILHAITGVPKWWLFAVCIPLAVLLAAAEERGAFDEPAGSHGAAGAARAAPE